MSQDSSSRRDFVAATAAVLAVSGSARAAMNVTEKNVEIKTPDGTCNAAFIHPTSGSHPAVIIWPDAFGLRKSMRDMGHRLAADGYSVLVVNPYYRIQPGPVVEDASGFDFAANRAQLQPLMGSIGADGAAEKDAVAFVEWLDKQKEVNKSKKIGTQGYCMGGALVVRTCAAVPERLGAGGSFHGGGLVTARPNSPHLMIPKIKGQLYFGIAANDDKSQPDAKDKLRDACDAAHVKAEIEVYTSMHGWCVPDMPAAGAPIYNKPEAEKAWAKLLALYKTAIA